MTLQVLQSQALKTVPPRKVAEELERTLRGCSPEVRDNEECGPELEKACSRCAFINELKRRFANSNIPISYWSLKMEDFVGNKILLDKYKEVTTDLNDTYHKGICMCFAGPHGIGKQLSLETELPTTDGFVKLADLKKGDKLFDEQGNLCNVTKLHAIQLSPESYEIEFDDGVKIEACAEHRWLTWDREARNAENRGCEGLPKVRTTKEILNTLKVGGKQQVTNHSIPCTKPLNYPEKNLIVDPYVLGAWLGDGTLIDGSIECADEGILLEIKKSGYSVNIAKSTIDNGSKSCRYRIGDLVPRQSGTPIGLLRKQLAELGVLGDKHIPDKYLYSSYEQRVSLLQGLMDTDGCCLETGLSEFSSTSSILAHQTYQLILSLGIKAKICKNKSYLNGEQFKDRYRISFTTQIPVFRLQRKLCNIRLKKQQLRRTTHRYIVNIVPIDSRPMRCITVDSPSHLFLVTRSFVPTHNTMTCANILKDALIKGYQCLYVTLSDIVVNAVSNAPDKYLARKELMMVDFLVIDEFDGRHMTDGASSDLFGRQLEDIFRKRSENRLPTFMCTNSPSVTDAFDGPVKHSISSLMSNAQIIPVLDRDFRKRDK
jgi:hypothetical protein